MHSTHGIALVQPANSCSAWFTKSAGPATAPPAWLNIPEYVGWWFHDNQRSILSRDVGEYTRAALVFPDAQQ